MAVELPVIQPGAPRERADAARNRRRILEAAAALADRRGMAAVSMDDVARAAHVGTGTLYRRFGDRRGLVHALLDERSRAFQDALIVGPPPLGPGAPPLERLHAFGEGYLDVLEEHAGLLVAGDPSGRDGVGAHGLYAAHLAHLLRQAAPGADAELLAEALLAAVSPGQVLMLHAGGGWPMERLRRGWHLLVDRLAGRDTAP